MILECVVALAKTYGPGMSFPLGNGAVIPTEQEAKFIDYYHDRALIISTDEIALFSHIFTLNDYYCLASFSVRMAILAERTHALELLQLSINIFFISENALDWRDSLRALSIIEHCSLKMGVDLLTLINSMNSIVSNDRLCFIMNSYFSRENEMRTIEIMGFKEIDGNIEHVSW